MILNEEINRALLQALACRDDRKRAEQALEARSAPTQRERGH
jgi:hypothetical protein